MRIDQKVALGCLLKGKTESSPGWMWGDMIGNNDDGNGG